MSDQLFEDIIEFPNPQSSERYTSLVGLDDIKQRLAKEAELLLNPYRLNEWSKKKHGSIIPLVNLFKNRHSFFIFGGDVGTGKTTLAESFGDLLARDNKLSIALYRLSLNSRGSGAVGEMTRLISAAFKEIKIYAEQIKKDHGKVSSACILLIDEADALAQSRELDQMHHEDRAGVNALIRGIDSITSAQLPIITVMCTNRLGAIDPAVRRRAAATFEFKRPNYEQRVYLLQQYLNGTQTSSEEINSLASKTGEDDKRPYGYTYSDISQRVLPAIVLQAFPENEITYAKILEILEEISPTPPFSESSKI